MPLTRMAFQHWPDNGMRAERREKRIAIVKPVYFEGEDAAKDFAISVNLSKSGICLITSLDVIPGQEMTVYSKFLWPGPKRAIAAWSSRLSPRVSRAGFTLHPKT